jgi:hypothetical protein
MKAGQDARRKKKSIDLINQPINGIKPLCIRNMSKVGIFSLNSSEAT